MKSLSQLEELFVNIHSKIELKKMKNITQYYVVAAGIEQSNH